MEHSSEEREISVHFNFCFDGSRLDARLTPKDYGMVDGDVIDALSRQSGD